MSFIEEFSDCFGGGVNINIAYPKGLAVSGYKKIVELSNSMIKLSLPQKRNIVICGESLSIVSLAESELFIKGLIVSVEFV